MKNKRFVKTADVLSVVKSMDPTAYVVGHTKKYMYQPATACSCCPDWVVQNDGFILHTNLSNKQLGELGVKSNSPVDFWGCY